MTSSYLFQTARTFGLVLILALTPGASAQVATANDALEAEMQRAQIEADKYWREANARGAGNMGSMWNEVDANEHQCIVLGSLLGKKAYVQAVETIPAPKLVPSMPSSDIEMLRIYSNSRTNFVVNAKHILTLSEHERVALWNLECVGSFGIDPAAAIEQLNTAAQFRIVGETLVVLGDIEAGFAEQLSQQIAGNTKIKTVSLGSAGGGVAEAMTAGHMIRAMRLDTTLYSNCYSACTLLFLGGVHRTIWSPYPKLGFHQASKGGKSIPPSDSTYRAVGDYAAAMGVSSKFVLAAMFSAKSDDLFFADAYALCENRVATWIQRLCP